MSTRKDATKATGANVPKKKVATKTSTRREESTDRSNAKKAEIPLKTRSTNHLAEKKADTVKNRINTKVEKPLKVQSSPHETPASSTRKTTKPKVPVTPPSNRVSKSQYFPSKSLYTNALKANESRNTQDVSGDTGLKEKTPQKTSKSKALASKTKDTVKKTSQTKIRSKLKSIDEKTVTKPTVEGKKPIRELSPDSSVSERPRTATLRKGSIVNANIVGPDVPKRLVPKARVKEVLKAKPPSPKSDPPDDNYYEDDFESYESDFEEYFSSSSTTSDDAASEGETSSITSSSGSEKVDEATKLKPAPNRVNSAGTDDERKLDSGNYDMTEVKHRRVLDNIRESIEKENANLKLQEGQRINPASLSDEGFEDQKSLQFINFLDAKKKCERRKSMELKRKRGEEILNMIRLDTYSFTLFDLPPVSYEVFIKNYGRHNTIQIGVQTGEDNVDESVQTEEIVYATKWTQFPVCFSKIDVDDPDYWRIYKADYLGVGGDVIVQENINQKAFNESSLEKFLLSAGNLILKIQAEATLDNKGLIRKNSREIPFSEGYILFNTARDIIKDCSVTYISFCSDNSKVLTVHSPKMSSVKEEYKSVVCVWMISNVEEPVIYLISYGDISCCCFGLDNTDFIYSGLKDGTISLWDLKKKIYNEDSSLKRTPLYTTEVGTGHVSKVVSLQHFSSQNEKSPYFNINQTNEICSLDEDGDIIIWSVIMKHSISGNSTSNSTSWNDVVLAKNSRVSLRRIYSELEDFRCTDFVVNTTDSNYVLISTNYGYILHHLIKGGRSNVKKFMPESASVANCIELCPFSSNYILIGFENGNINLYSRMVEKPIMVLSDKEENLNSYGIEIVQWSKFKPFVIYTKDVNNTIHIWDLNESDIFPIYSVPFNQTITCMKLSPMIGNDGDQQSYMIIGTDDGNVYLHIFNKEHGPQPNQLYKEQLNTFLKYVNRL